MIRRVIKIALKTAAILLGWAVVTFIGIVVCILINDSRERERFFASLPSLTDILFSVDEREAQKQRREFANIISIIGYSPDELEVQRQISEFMHVKLTAEKMNYQRNLQQSCRYEWDELWPLAKEGNLFARRRIKFLLGPERIAISGPGEERGGFAKNEFLLFYSLGPAGLLNDRVNSEPIGRGLLSIEAVAKNTRLSECLRQNADASCTKIAIEDGVIPSYEAYTEAIDTYLQGDVHCYAGHGIVAIAP